MRQPRPCVSAGLPSDDGEAKKPSVNAPSQAARPSTPLSGECTTLGYKALSGCSQLCLGRKSPNPLFKAEETRTRSMRCHLQWPPASMWQCLNQEPGLLTKSSPSS